MLGERCKGEKSNEISPCVTPRRLNRICAGLSKRYRADVAWEEFDELYRRRLESNDVKVARALERNFARPARALEQQTKGYIDQYTAQVTAKWETEVFAQRKRKGAAEESLRTKETKSARENVRIATKRIETLIVCLPLCPAGGLGSVFPFPIL
jgi:hypothetical protein